MIEQLTNSEWVEGRVGMLYRDLTPTDIADDVLISQIRLPFDGEVPDYVHFHNIAFQVIYCVKGRIKVVYEDQGPPFWLEAGSAVLQPPEIRHRVLESRGNAAVVEIVIPAEHETSADHAMTLPTVKLDRDRRFSGQRFVRVEGMRDVAAAVEAIFAEQPVTDGIAELIRKSTEIAARSISRDSDGVPEA